MLSQAGVTVAGKGEKSSSLLHLLLHFTTKRLTSLLHFVAVSVKGSNRPEFRTKNMKKSRIPDGVRPGIK